MIGRPDLVRSGSGELSAHQIRRRYPFRVPAGSGDLAAAVNPLDAGLAHQAGHPLSAHSHTLGGEFGPDTGRTIGAPGPAVDLHDPVPQNPIRLLPGGWRAAQPCVIATGGDTQQPHMRRTE